MSQARDSFKSRWGFIFASIGSAVGMANIWRFPIMVSRYGGLTYLIPYFLCVILVASTGVIEETALGRAAKASPVGAFGYCAGLKGKKSVGEAIGYIPTLGSVGLAIGYSVVTGWTFKYMFMAFGGKLASLGQDMGSIGGLFDNVAVDNAPFIILALIITFAIMSLGIAGGIEKANKYLMPLLFGAFIFLAIYVATLPGAGEGYKYIFSLNPAGLADPFVWIYAFGQAFFSLSVAGNGTVIYGSYFSDEGDIVSAARNIAIFDSLAAMLAALVIIPAMAATGVSCDSSGPGLMFIYLVNVFNGMKGGRLVSIVFFVSVVFAAMSSIVNLYEASVALLQEKFNMKRIVATATMIVFCCVIATLIQPITSQWMDVLSIYVCPAGALLAAIMFFWVGGRKFAEDEVSKGRAKRIGAWFYLLGKYAFCAAAIFAIVAGIVLGGIG